MFINENTRYLAKLISPLLVTFSVSSHAATFEVTHTQDVLDDGICDVNCSLREAVIAANQTPGADIISIPAGTYILQIPGQLEDLAQSGDFDLNDDVVINGAGRDLTIINAAGMDRSFHVMQGINVTISNMNIINGTTSVNGGAGIWNMGGNLTVQNVELSNNTVVLSNTANGGTYVYGDGGGAIKNRDQNDGPSSLRVENSYLNNNCASSGGGIENLGDLTIINTTIANNTPRTNCAIEYGGAGIYIQGGAVSIDRSSIVNNWATNNPWGGGGIHNWSGQLNITNSTIALNQADAGAGLLNHGGGRVAITNSTIANNNALNGGGIHTNNEQYNGIFAEIQLVNTILANNTAQTGPDCTSNDYALYSAGIVSLGNNLIGQPTAECGLTLTTSDLTGDPGLEVAELSILVFPPEMEGHTLPLLATSQAIDSGNNTACPQIDQTGTARPLDGNNDAIADCDIGAIEHDAYAIQPLIARDDLFSTMKNTPLTASSLANDSASTGSTISAHICDPTTMAGGFVVCNPDGTFNYEPALDFTGMDSFSYTIFDESGSASANVYIEVIAPNTAPVALADSATTTEDTSVSVNVLANDSDIDNDALTVSSCSATAAGGVVSCNANGMLSYQPPLDFSGTDSFSYTISDGEFSTSATVTIDVTAVNDAPVACALIPATGYAREAISFSASCSTDSDSTALTYQWDFGDDTGIVSGETVTHEFKRRQSYTVTMTVSDGESSSSYSSTIDIIRAPKGGGK